MNATTPTTDKPRTVKTKVWADADAVETLRKRLDLTASEFSISLGLSSHAYADAVKRGKVSQTVHLAAEALVRRQFAQDVAFLVRVVKGAPQVTLVEHAEIATIGGRRYLMVPQS